MILLASAILVIVYLIKVMSLFAIGEVIISNQITVNIKKIL